MPNKIPSSIGDLQEFITNKIPEGKTLDYKISLPGNSDEDKKEFLSDVSAFANTVGGVLIYGMNEEQGIAFELKGMEISNIESETLRLENILRDGISPRIININILPIQIADNTYAIRIYIPQSILSPHMVTYKSSSRFYARNSAGKYLLDIQEIKQAFLLSESLTEKIKRFKIERISKILSGDTPILTGERSKIVIHSISLSSFGINQNFDVQEVVRKQHNFFVQHKFDFRYNLDGLLLYLKLGNENKPVTEYLQVFRNLEMEYFTDYLLSLNIESEKPEKIDILEIENDIINICKDLFDYQKSLDVEPPLFIFISVLGVKGLMFKAISRTSSGTSIDRDNLFLPEVSIDNYPKDKDEVSKILKPLFDAFWNSAGFPRSLGYDENGNKISRRNSY